MNRKGTDTQEWSMKKRTGNERQGAKGKPWNDKKEKRGGHERTGAERSGKDRTWKGNEKGKGRATADESK